MFEARNVVVVLSLIAKIHCRMEGFIVGGEPAQISEFPYAAYISTSCEHFTGFWACGGSIINQGIIVTAAHCVHSCPDDKPVGKVSISVGSTMKNRGQITQARTYICHERFDKNDFAGYDIALVRTQHRLRFNKQTSRVAIMRIPPVAKEAQVAGWGFTDVCYYFANCILRDTNKNLKFPLLLTKYHFKEVNLASPVNLMKLSQVIWTKRQCENLYGYLLPSNFCATSGHTDKYIAA